MPDSPPFPPPAAAVGAIAREARGRRTLKRARRGWRDPFVAGNEALTRERIGQIVAPTPDAARAGPQGVRGRCSALRNRRPLGRNPLISNDRKKYKFSQISAAAGAPRRRAEASPTGGAVTTTRAVRGAEKRPRPAVAAAPDAKRRPIARRGQSGSSIKAEREPVVSPGRIIRPNPGASRRPAAR
jgi:hypothetical protein